MTEREVDGASDDELTIDQLAAKTGLTVRTVRSYTTRGLLPPPRLRGRTGLYGREHLARLAVLREMLDAGYTLAAAEQVLTAAPTGLSGPGLEVFRSLLTPWAAEEPEVLDRQVLSARIGVPLDDDRMARLEIEGLARLLPDGRVEVTSPLLTRSAVQLAALGIGFDLVLETHAELMTLSRRMADACVRLFKSQVWEPFEAAGAPDEGWPAMAEALDRVLPVAAQSVLATFRRALTEEIAAQLEVARAEGRGFFQGQPAASG